MRKVIQIFSGICTITLGIAWVVGISFDFAFKEFIEPISFITTGIIWIILELLNKKIISEDIDSKTPKPLGGKSIFQIIFGNGINVGGNYNELKKKRKNNKSQT